MLQALDNIYFPITKDNKGGNGGSSEPAEDYQIKINMKGLTTYQSMFGYVGNYLSGSIEGEWDFTGVTKANYMFSGAQVESMENLKLKNTQDLQ